MRTTQNVVIISASIITAMNKSVVLKLAQMWKHLAKCKQSPLTGLTEFKMKAEQEFSSHHGRAVIRKKYYFEFLVRKNKWVGNFCLPNVAECSCEFLGLRKEGKWWQPPILVFTHFSHLLSELYRLKYFWGIPSLNLLTSCMHVSWDKSCLTFRKLLKYFAESGLHCLYKKTPENRESSFSTYTV